MSLVYVNLELSQLTDNQNKSYLLRVYLAVVTVRRIDLSVKHPTAHLAGVITPALDRLDTHSL